MSPIKRTRPNTECLRSTPVIWGGISSVYMVYGYYMAHVWPISVHPWRHSQGSSFCYYVMLFLKIFWINPPRMIHQHANTPRKQSSEDRHSLRWWRDCSPSHISSWLLMQHSMCQVRQHVGWCSRYWSLSKVAVWCTRHFQIHFNGNIWISMIISPDFDPDGPIDNA